MSPLRSAPCLSSSAAPDLLPPLPHTLLPEFYSNPQRDHRPPAPVTQEEGKFQPVPSAAAGAAAGATGAGEGVHKFPHTQWNIQGRTSFTLSDTNTSAPLFSWPSRLLLSLPVSQLAAFLSVYVSVAPSPCVCVCVCGGVGAHQTCRATFQLPASSAPPALSAGLVGTGEAGGACLAGVAPGSFAAALVTPSSWREYCFSSYLTNIVF